MKFMYPELLTTQARIGFPLNRIAPCFISKNTFRSRPPIGLDKEWPMDAYIDSLPVPMRMEALGKMINARKKYSVYQYLATLRMQKDYIRLHYMEYHVSMMFLEAEALRILFRLVYKKLLPQEMRIVSVSDFIKYVKKFMMMQYSYEMKFITPRMILDWISLMMQSCSLKIEVDSELFTDAPTPTSFVTLEFRSWHLALEARLNKLRLTGYENIDL